MYPEFERNRKNVIFLNETVPCASASELRSPFFINKRNIVACLAPTFKYASGYEKIDTEKEKKYHEEIKAAKEVSEMKINHLSKYKKIQKAYEEYDKKTKELNVKCISGCSFCCSDLFLISEPEFLYMISLLVRENRYAELFRIYKKARIQTAYIKENFTFIYELLTSDRGPASNFFYNIGASFQMAVSCPALKNGKCICYRGRPSICRVYGFTGTCEYIGNRERKELNKPLFNVPFYIRDGARYSDARQPISFFAERYLSPGKINELIKKLRKFTGVSENELTEGKYIEKIVLEV